MTLISLNNRILFTRVASSFSTYLCQPQVVMMRIFGNSAERLAPGNVRTMLLKHSKNDSIPVSMTDKASSPNHVLYSAAWLLGENPWFSLATNTSHKYLRLLLNMRAKAITITPYSHLQPSRHPNILYLQWGRHRVSPELGFIVHTHWMTFPKEKEKNEREKVPGALAATAMKPWHGSKNFFCN